MASTAAQVRAGKNRHSIQSANNAGAATRTTRAMVRVEELFSITWNPVLMMPSEHEPATPKQMGMRRQRSAISSSAIRGVSSYRRSWKAYSEHRAPALFAGHRHLTAHHASELAGDREAQSGVVVFLGGRRLRLGEFLEQSSELLRGHADAGVGHRKLDGVAAI